MKKPTIRQVRKFLNDYLRDSSGWDCGPTHQHAMNCTRRALELLPKSERLNGLIESLKHSCDERVENERNLIRLVRHWGNRVSDLAAANKTIAEQCKRLNDEREYYQANSDSNLDYLVKAKAENMIERLKRENAELKEKNSILYSTLSLITGPSPMSFDHQTLKWIRETGKKALEKRDTAHAGLVCSKCGKPGSHFVPPSLGQEGIWICDVDQSERDDLGPLGEPN